jgi:hypothetical protein
VRNGARSLAAIVLMLVASGILASVALGESCAVTIRWNDVVYASDEARFVALEPGDALGEAEIPHCGTGGRCAPPEETVAAFEIADVPPEAAVLAPDYFGLFVAGGTFPQLRDHPLHEALYGSPSRPSYRTGCGKVFRLEATVEQASPLRLDVQSSDVPVDESDEGAWLEVDSGTRIEGFDRDGIATLEVGDEIVVRAQRCVGHGELAGPLAELIEPAR